MSARPSLRLRTCSRLEVEGAQGQALYQTWLTSEPITRQESADGPRSVWLMLSVDPALKPTEASLERVKVIFDRPTPVLEQSECVARAASVEPSSCMADATLSEALDRQASSPVMRSDFFPTALSREGSLPVSEQSGASRPSVVLSLAGASVALEASRTSPSLWQLKLDLPQACASGSGWVVADEERAHGERLSGPLRLSGNLVVKLSDGREVRELLSTPLSTSCLLSRHVFLCLSRDDKASWGLDDAYPSLVAHLLSRRRPACKDVYEPIWLHGLLLAMLARPKQQVGICRRPAFAVQDCLDALASVAAQTLVDGGRKLLSGSAALLVYGLVGQTLLMLRHHGVSAADLGFADFFWGSLGPSGPLLSADAVLDVREWAKLARTDKGWAYGVQHVLHFARHSLRALLDQDVKAPVPTFRSAIVAVPLLYHLQGLESVGKVSFPTVTAPLPTLQPVSEFEAVVEGRVNGTHEHLTDSFDQDVSTTAAAQARSMLETYRQRLAGLLHSLKGLDVDPSSLSSLASLNQALHSAYEAAAAAASLIEPAQRAKERLHAELAATRTSDLPMGASVAVRAMEAALTGPGEYVVQTLAGSGAKGMDDGLPSDASFNLPSGVVDCGDGRLLVCDTNNNALRVIEAGGHVITLVGQAGSGAADGPVGRAQLNKPKGICRAHDGSILIADTNNHRIRRLSPDWSTLSTLPDDGLASPADVLERSDGVILVADKGNNCIRALRPLDGGRGQQKGRLFGRDSDQVSAVFAGVLRKKGTRDRGVATEAHFGEVVAISEGPDGSIYVCERGRNSIRRIHPSGRTQTLLLAVSGVACPTEGVGFRDVAANLTAVVALDPHTLLVSDTGNHAIWRVLVDDDRAAGPDQLSPRVTLLAHGLRKDHVDGASEQPTIHAPLTLVRCVDSSLVLAEGFGNRVRRLQSREMAMGALERLRRAQASMKRAEETFLRAVMESDALVRVAYQHAHAVRDSLAAVKREAQEVIFGRIAGEFSHRARWPDEVQPETLAVVVSNVPALSCLPAMLGGQPWPEETLQLVKDGLLSRLRSVSWSDPEASGRDLQAMSLLMALYGEAVVDHQVLGRVVGDKSFTLPLLQGPVLEVLDTYLQLKGWPSDRVATSQIRSNILKWFGWLLPSTEITLDGLAPVLDKALLAWTALDEERVRRGLGRDVTFKWLMKVHVDSICMRLVQLSGTKVDAKGDEVKFSHKVSCFREALACTARVDAMGEPISQGVLEVLSSSMVDCLYSLSPSDAVNSLLTAAVSESTPLSRISAAAAAFPSRGPRLQYLQLTVLAELVGRALSDVLKASEDKRPPKAGEEAAPVSPSAIVIKTPTLFREADMWGRFALWFSAVSTTSFASGGGLEQPAVSEAWSGLAAAMGRTMPVFQRLSDEVVTGQASIDLVSTSLSSHDALQGVWLALGSPLSDRAAMVSAMERCNSLLFDLQAIKDVALDLFPDSTLASSISVIESFWRELSTYEAAKYLRATHLGLPEPPASFRYRLTNRAEPVPQPVLDALAWLQVTRKSRVFRLVWEEQQHVADDVERLHVASVAWRALYMSLDDGSIPFPRLAAVVPLVLVDKKELVSLARTATSQEAQAWAVVKPDASWVDTMQVRLEEWEHVSCVKHRLPQLRDLLQLLPSFLHADARPEVAPLVHSLEAFQRLVEQADWDMLQLKDVPSFLPTAKAMDPRLVRLDAPLLRAIDECGELLVWLRSQPSDKDFQSSLEIAMGKSEMECPIELWDEQPGRAGRVDEQKLSMLRNVRSYLHEFLYRPVDLFLSFAAFLDTMAGYRYGPDASQITENLRVCFTLRHPLEELLGSTAETAAPNRLIQLQQPKRAAVWLVSNRPGVGLDAVQQQGKSVSEAAQAHGNLCMQYRTVRRDQAVTVTNRIDDLLDFQSAIVLAEARSAAVVDSSTDLFVRQFAWVRGLSEATGRLHAAGHFDFLPTYHFEYSLLADPEDIRAEVVRLQAELKDWEARVQEVRRASFYINSFTLQQVWELILLLQRVSEAEASAEDLAFLRDFLCCVNPSAYGNSQVVQTLRRLLSRHAGPQLWSGAPADRLSQVAAVLDSALSEAIHFRERPIAVAKADLHAAGAEISRPGVYLAVCKGGYAEVIDSAFSCYVRAGILPESQDFLNCGADTRWEDVNRILLNWEKGHRYGLPARLFCLASVDRLPFDIQHRAAHAIREYLPQAAAPLLLLSGASTESSHLVTQYAHCRVVIHPLPLAVLQDAGRHVASLCGKGVAVHMSAHPGTGKSFNIRRQAVRDACYYVHIPINRRMTAPELIGIILSNPNFKASQRQGGGGKKDVVLHFDLAHTAVCEDLDGLVLDVVVLSSLRDPKGSRYFFLDPSVTSFAIELASLGPTFELGSCRTMFLLPLQVASVVPSSFVSDEQGLRDGFGHDFHSTRFGGFERTEDGAPLTAYHRLQYVCRVLQTMEENGGSFPYRFPEADVLGQGPPVPGATCFELLAHASQLHSRPSLWCLWNFANCLYWQLRNMHHPESPINCACMPDESATSDRDKLRKMKMKGEIIIFMIKTAREFATRQTGAVDRSRVTHAEVYGFSKPEWNKTWAREAYDNDGQPVFSTRTTRQRYFLYYRSLESQWVIDGAVEAEGVVFSTSKTRTLDPAAWHTSPSWAQNRSIHVTKARNAKAFNSESVIVAIDRPGIGGSVTAEEAGEYLRQPAYDNICDKPHYIKFGPGERRHLFWNKVESCWQICPTCTDEDGAFCMGDKGDNMEGVWWSVPPDIVERGVKIRMVTLGQRLDEQARLAEEAAVRNQAAGRGGAAAQAVEEDGDDEARKRRSEVEAVLTSGQLAQMEIEMVKWNDSNHECLLFSNASHSVYFMSLSGSRLRDEMHPGMLEHLARNEIKVGESMEELNAKAYDILSGVTGVRHAKDMAGKLLGGNYCLTGDSMLKMLAIYVRVLCGIPVVLMGECGCGKTMSISYLCAWLGAKLITLDIHGGTTEADIIGVFERAREALAAGSKEVYVFLDEVNTCAHMGLITEAICHSSVNGQPLGDGIKVLAALNPYRRRPKREQTPGLVYNLGKHGAAGIPDPMSDLVYRVHPIPETLKDFIFDFGSLQKKQEKDYIALMVKSNLKGIDEDEVEILTELLSESQDFVRRVEMDASSTSLRDVQRCLSLMKWFLQGLQQAETPSAAAKAKISALGRAAVLALAHVYYYRLASVTDRQNYDYFVVKNTVSAFGRVARKVRMHLLCNSGTFNNVLLRNHRRFAENLVIEDGVAMNQALMENLFVIIVCILNRIPCFVVGKPGSSKTLTMQVVASNLLGKQSPKLLWQGQPAVYLFQYQCSPMSSSHSIQHQFDMAVSYQQQAHDVVTVLLLDEVGLAEHSPDMPLKVLHGILVNPPIAIVGISNWVLDPAKMNRAICLQRPEPTEDDILLTGKSIISGGAAEGGAGDDDAEGSSSAASQPQAIAAKLGRWLDALARAYHEVYGSQKGRDYLGMRDYYCLLKLLRHQLSGGGNDLNRELLTFSVCRNFGGKPELLQRTLEAFHYHCFGTSPETHSVQFSPVKDLIEANLADMRSRHLMLLTRNGSALPVMFACGLLREADTMVLVGSEFSDDVSELHLVQQINLIKYAMANGQTVVLYNHDNIYEALYDVLNQRYVLRTNSKTGLVSRMLRLAIGSRSQLCPVAESFKIIVIVEAQHAYDRLDLPLLNRFEKQLLTPMDVLGAEQREVVEDVMKWCDQVVDESGADSYQSLFCGFHEGTVPSLMLALAKDEQLCEEKDPAERRKAWLQAMKQRMAQIALPYAILRSSMLQEVQGPKYFEHHSSFAAAYRHYIESQAGGAMAVMLTFSPIMHLKEALPGSTWSDGTTAASMAVFQVAQFNSERQLEGCVSSFLRDRSGDAPAVLVLQCDPVACKQSAINHVKHICVHQRALVRQEAAGRAAPLPPRHVVILIHLPPGIQSRVRHYAVDFYAPWTCVFVDDLRNDAMSDPTEHSRAETGCSLVELMNKSAYELAVSGRLPLPKTIMANFQVALSRCVFSTAEGTDEEAVVLLPTSYTERITLVRHLLATEPRFLSLLENCVLSLLRAKSSVDRRGMHLHVSMACTDVAVGTLRQSIHLALDHIVTRALTLAFRMLDCDFNLSLLQPLASPSPNPSSLEVVDLWLKLTSCPTIIDLSAMAGSLAVAGKQQHTDIYEEIPSNGKRGAFATSFPFSYKIVGVLDDPATRSRLQQEASASSSSSPSHLCDQLDALLRTIFGDDIVSLWTRQAAPLDYLHDLIAITAPPVPGLTVSRQARLYRAVLQHTLPDRPQTPAWAHAALSFNHSRIFHLGSLLARPELPGRLKDDMLAHTEALASTGTGGAAAREQLDVAVLRLVFAFLEHEAEVLVRRTESEPIYGPGGEALTRAMAALFPDLEALLAGVVAASLHEAVELQEALRGLKLLHMYFHEAAALTRQRLLDQRRPSATDDDEPYDESGAPERRVVVAQAAGAAAPKASEPVSGRLRAVQLLQLVQHSRERKGSRAFLEGLITVLPRLVSNRPMAQQLAEAVLLRFVLEVSLVPAVGGDEDEEGVWHYLTGPLLSTPGPAHPVACWSTETSRSFDPLRLQLAVLGRLLTLESKWSRLVEEKVLTQSYGCQLYLQLTADLVSSQVTAEDDDRMLTLDDVALLSRNAHFDPAVGAVSCTRRRFLNVLARAQVLLRRRAWSVLSPGGAEAQSQSTTTVNALLQDPALTWTGVYALRHVNRTTGIAGLAEVLQVWHREEPASLSWLPRLLDKGSRVSKTMINLSLLDPFPCHVSKRSTYDKLCEGLLAYLCTGATAPLDTALRATGAAGERKAMLASAIFSQVLTEPPTSPLHCQLPQLKSYFSGEHPLSSLSWAFTEGEARLFNWLLRGCPTVLYRPSCELPPTARIQRQELLVTQVTVHLATVVLSYPSSWLATLLFLPRWHANNYLPSMPDDPFLALVQASGYVGWYKCPNGHLYTVGNCTWPMESTRCRHPGCNALIGGGNHTPATGNTRLEVTDLGDSKPGYDAATTGSEGEARYNIQIGPAGRGSPASIRVLRLFIHLLMRASALHGPSRADAGVERLMFPEMTTPSTDYVVKELTRRIESDWSSLRSYTSLNDEDLTLALHLVLLRLTGRQLDNTSRAKSILADFGATLNTARDRQAFDEAFEVHCVRPVFVGVREVIKACRESLSDNVMKDYVRRSLDPAMWTRILELDPLPQTHTGYTSQMLYRLSEPVTLEGFHACFNLDSFNARSFPLLAAFLREEPRLSLIKYTADVLEWHALLFDVFKAEPISREEAGQLTNQQVIDRLPEARRPAAQALLSRYCEGFNLTLPCIPLFECKDNPYLTTEKKLVDLSGSRDDSHPSPMGPDTPVCFSLATIMAGELDGPGSCTTQILHFLQGLQNQLVTQLRVLQEQTEGSQPTDPGVAEEKGGERLAALLGQQEGMGQQPDEQLRELIPPTSHLTQRETLLRELISYDRRRDLLPLLTANANRKLKYASGVINGYDMGAIQRGVSNALLSMARPILIQVTLFQYAGELRKTDQLVKLKTRVEQSELPRTVLDAVWAEIDTNNRLRRLLNQIEVCIGFLVNIGGSAVRQIDGNTKLQDYVLGVLMTPQPVWEEISCPTLCQSVRLCHLQQLFMYLEERMDGGPLANVLAKYRARLSPEMDEDLRLRAGRMSLSVLLPILRELVITQLTSDNSHPPPPDASLKMYLEFSDVDLEGTTWFQEGFPEDLQLAQAFCAYQLLSEIALS